MSNSVDGFVNPVGQKRKQPKIAGVKPSPTLDLRQKPVVSTQEKIKPVAILPKSNDLGYMTYQPKTSNIDEQIITTKLLNLDLEDSTEESKPKRKRSKKKIALRVIGIVLLAGVAFGSYFGYRTYKSTGRVFHGSIVAALFSDAKPLRTDSYGRSNVLLFGTSEDDPGHPGGDLTDSIMVISLDQKKNDAFMFSIPRDLWVQLPSHCLSGNQGKINAVYECGKQAGGESEGQKAIKSSVSQVFDIDLQYVVHVNYKVLRNSIDALGGVDVTINSPDPRGILDRNFDWRCQYKCYLVKYPNGPVHLSGDQALYLAQARGASGGYGLPRANFDREANQRKIMIAAKEKATNIGFLANPLSVTKLLDSLGDNVRTNISANEIKTFVKLMKQTSSNNINSISLVDQVPELLTTGPAPDGSSAVQPKKAIDDFSDLQSFIKVQLSGKGWILKEGAVVDVLNASGVSGAARNKANTIAKDGIVVGNVASTAVGDYPPIALYDLSKGTKNQSKAELENLFGIKATTASLPAGYQTKASFVIIVGKSTSSAQ